MRTKLGNARALAGAVEDCSAALGGKVPLSGAQIAKAQHRKGSALLRMVGRAQRQETAQRERLSRPVVSLESFAGAGGRGDRVC